MTFTINQFNSPEAQKIDTAIRNKLLFQLKQANSFGQKSIQELRQLLEATPTAELIPLTYVNAKQYEQLQIVQDELSSGDGRTESQFGDEAVHMYRYAVSIIYRPVGEDYETLIDSVNQTLATYSILEKSDERVHDAIGDLLSCLLDYAHKCTERYEQFRTLTEAEMTNQLTSYAVDFSSKTVWTHSYSFDITPLKSKFTKMNDYILDPGTYDEVVKFLLSRDIGTFGSAYIPDISFLIFVSIIPFSIKPERMDIIWSTRKKAAPLGQISDHMSEVDDTETRAMQSSVLSSLATNNLPQHRDNSIKRSLHKKSAGNPEDEDGAAEFGMSSSTTPVGRRQQKKPTRGRRRKGDESPRPSRSSKGPQTPDDTNYEPDAALASRAADMTKEYRAMDPPNMDHDHMTRFSTTSEASTSLSRAQVRQTDWTFITKTRYQTTRYLVTFTRKSKKPIFSIVSQ